MAGFYRRFFFTSVRNFETLSVVGRVQSIIPSLAGLNVRVDQLFYMPALEAPPDRPHPFTYFISIENGTDRPLTLIGRKWIVRQEVGGIVVVEGSGVVGQKPLIGPGETFSYNSYHTVGANADVSGAFLFQDDLGDLFVAKVPEYHLEIPLWGL